MWLFSRRVDLAVFLGPALLALGLLGIGHVTGLLQGDAPTWIWLPAVVLVDVSHVWATTFRVYLDRQELERRPWLYGGVPVACYVLGLALYSEGELVFWGALAYVAVFHFVRQQYGWVMRYRRKAQETTGYWLDALTIYTMTCYPLLHWHLSLPRRFQWFMPGDFLDLGLPDWLDAAGRVAFFGLLGLYSLRSARARFANLGKDIVVWTTAACWYLGIVTFDSDYAFTVTNVLIHGIPHFAIVFQYVEARREFLRFAPSLGMFLLVLWLVGFGEELLWDKAIWHDVEHRVLFGKGWDLGDWKLLLVPLLALPQFTHYVLDGFVWRRSRTNDQALAGRVAA